MYMCMHVPDPAVWLSKTHKRICMRYTYPRPVSSSLSPLSFPPQSNPSPRISHLCWQLVSVQCLVFLQPLPTIFFLKVDGNGMQTVCCYGYRLPPGSDRGAEETVAGRESWTARGIAAVVKTTPLHAHLHIAERERERERERESTTHLQNGYPKVFNLCVWWEAALEHTATPLLSLCHISRQGHHHNTQLREEHGLAVMFCSNPHGVKPTGILRQLKSSYHTGRWHPIPLEQISTAVNAHNKHVHVTYKYIQKRSGNLSTPSLPSPSPSPSPVRWEERDSLYCLGHSVKGIPHQVLSLY